MKEVMINVGSRMNSLSFFFFVVMERNVVLKFNVVIKEIINIGIFGWCFFFKSFCRFERSLFDVLDNFLNYGYSLFDEEFFFVIKSFVLNLWNIFLVVSKWMFNV